MSKTVFKEAYGSPISALGFEPSDLIREVSTESIEFYVSGLAGVRLPEEFVQNNQTVQDVKRWDAGSRLHGKFGRFAVRTDTDVAIEPDFLLMGTTLGVGGFDRDDFMRSLRHFEFYDHIFGAIIRRGISQDDDFQVRAVDYGSTQIKTNNEGEVVAVGVGGQSLDFGRADAAGRQSTCQLFRDALGSEIEVVNEDPAPRVHCQVIKTL